MFIFNTTTENFTYCKYIGTLFSVKLNEPAVSITVILKSLRVLSLRYLKVDFFLWSVIHVLWLSEILFFSCSVEGERKPACGL